MKLLKLYNVILAGIVLIILMRIRIQPVVLVVILQVAGERLQVQSIGTNGITMKA